MSGMYRTALPNENLVSRHQQCCEINRTNVYPPPAPAPNSFTLLRTLGMFHDLDAFQEAYVGRDSGGGDRTKSRGGGGTGGFRDEFDAPGDDDCYKGLTPPISPAQVSLGVVLRHVGGREGGEFRVVSFHRILHAIVVKCSNDCATALASGK